MCLIFSFLAAAAQGAIDEDAFYNAFESVPKIQVFNFPLFQTGKFQTNLFYVTYKALFSERFRSTHVTNQRMLDKSQ